MGYFKETGTKVTWKNPQFVPENQRANGGWYYNPSSGSVDRWWTDSGGGGNQGSGGQAQQRSSPTIDYQAIIDKQAADRKAEQDRLDAEQAGLFNTYETQAKGQESLTSAYGRISGEQGIAADQATVDTMNARIGELKTGLNELDQAIKERTAGQFVSEAQRARLAATEKAGIGTELARTAEAAAPVIQNLTQKRGEVGTQLQLLQTQQQKELNPAQMRINAFSAKYATEMTGFNQDKSNELTTLLASISRQQTLSDQDWARANALADQETQWQQTKDELALKSSYAIAEKGAPTYAQSQGTGTGNASDYYGSGTSVGGSSGGGLPVIPSSTPSSGGAGPQTNWLAYAFGNRYATA